MKGGGPRRFPPRRRMSDLTKKAEAYLGTSGRAISAELDPIVEVYGPNAAAGSQLRLKLPGNRPGAAALASSSFTDDTFVASPEGKNASLESSDKSTNSVPARIPQQTRQTLLVSLRAHVTFLFP